MLLTALIAGTALASLVVGAVADRMGRRRCYAGFCLLLAMAGAAMAADAPFWLMLLIAQTGALSTDVVDNGPATTLEQVMLAGEDAGTSRVYGRYNAIGASRARSAPWPQPCPDSVTRQAAPCMHGSSRSSSQPA